MSRAPQALVMVGLASLLAVGPCACDRTSSASPQAPANRPPAAGAGKENDAPGLSERGPDKTAPGSTGGAATAPDAPEPRSLLDDLPSPDPRFVEDGRIVVPWLDDSDAQGQHGVVTSVERHATQAGALLLEAGGNAIDAAVATGLALAVTHPSAGNLGGGGFLVLKHGRAVEALDFREDSPRALTDERFWAMIRRGGRGGAAVGVPGTVAGLYLAHQRHGRLPWRQVVQPALRLARDGFALGLRQAQTLIWAQAEFSRDPVAREVFYSKRPAVGVVIRQSALAETLARIAERGPAGFYEGPVAEDIVASLGEHGLLSLEDLQGYRARWREPLHVDVQGFRVVTLPAPSAGGVALTQNLLMLRQLDVSQTAADSAARYHLWAEVSRRSQVERQLFVVAPESLTASERLAARDRALSASTWLEEHPVDPQRATDSKSLDARFDRVLAELPHTTHFSVIDAEGNLVSCTVTLSGSFGARIMTRRTGIVLNNSVASFSSLGTNTPGPGRRTTSSMAPTLAFLGKDHALVLGSPGGNTIPNTVTQVFSRLAWDGSSLKEAVAAPRVHQGFVPQHLQLERKVPLPAALIERLRALGHNPQASRYTMGDANVAAFVAGSSGAVFDRREGGAARAAKPRDAPPD